MSDTGLVLTVDVIYFAISANVCHLVSFCVVTPLRGEFAIRAFCPPYEAVLRVGSSAVEERGGEGRSGSEITRLSLTLAISSSSVLFAGILSV
jgi:hypothetical protein